MAFLLKLYASGLDSECSPMPLTMRNKQFYELTLCDLKDQIFEALALRYKAPYY